MTVGGFPFISAKTGYPTQQIGPAQQMQPIDINGGEDPHVSAKRSPIQQMEPIEMNGIGTQLLVQ